MRREMDLGAQDVPGSRLRIEWVREAGQFVAMRAEWRALHAASDASIFSSWEWLYPWYRRLGEDRDLRLLCARDAQGRLVGLLPLCVQARRGMGRLVRRLAFLGEHGVGSDYLGVLAVRDQAEAITRALLLAVRDNSAGWDLLDLLDLEEHSLTSRLLRELFAGPHWQARATERYTCPYEPFAPGEDFEAFLRRTKRRDNYRRRRRWLEQQPGYRIERSTQPVALARPLAEFFRLHHLRWSVDGGSQGITSPATEAFHRDATRLLAEQGELRLYTMWVGERAVASVYGIVHRDRFIYFQSGYDPDWRSKSVGLVLVGATFEDAFASGLREYDFLRGTESYKYDWVSQARRTVAFRCWPKGGVGRWLDRQERALKVARGRLKAALPEPWVERVRRTKRQLGWG
jgi:CelD/BcsL family acetyltransferase involved in cellulose biosynthesis